MVQKKKIALWLSECKNMLKSKLPSEQHELYWQDYEKLLCYRSNFGQIQRLFFNLVQLFMGRLPFVKTQELLQTDTQNLNTSLSEELLPYAKWALIAAIFGRVILLLISMKRLSICKVHIYYEFLIFVVLMCLPQGTDQELGVTLFLEQVFTNFILHYFHLWSSIFAMLVVQLLYFSSRIMLYNEPLDGEIVFSCLFSMFWMSLNFVMIHLVMTKVGYLYTEMCILSTGNE